MGEDAGVGLDESQPVIMISALEHYSYCPRQCALIHLEQIFEENLYTLRGRALHERVDEPGGDLAQGVRAERALPLWSERLGLVGRADVVEFHGDTPYPVDYKHGPKRTFGHDDLQLCAQAMCLEEMTGRPVPRGAIYHYASRRRREVIFGATLRGRVEETVAAIRRMMISGVTPPPVNDARCRHCSLISSCLPAAVAESVRLQDQQTLLFPGIGSP